jgi:hypothetical protein
LPWALKLVMKVIRMVGCQAGESSPDRLKQLAEPPER